MPAYQILPDQCTWLMRGKISHCPRKSRGSYCAQHLFQIIFSQLCFSLAPPSLHNIYFK